MFQLNLSLLEQKDLEQVASLSEDIERVIELRRKTELKTGALSLDPVFLSRHLLDIVPNPWIAHEFGKTVLKELIDRYDEKMVLNNFVFIIEELRKHLAAEKDRLAESVFRKLIDEDKLHFLIITNKIGYKLPKQRKVHPPRLTKSTGDQLERSLFDYVPRDEFNEMEMRVAWYLDDQDKLFFWYRNIPKQDYAVQGWRKPRVFADFIFTDKSNGNGFNRVFVVETKGLHLKDSDDTKYKKTLFALCNERSKETNVTELGLKMHAEKVSFAVVDESEWQNQFNALFSSQSTT